MRWWLCLWLLWPAAAAAELRAVFVGIDRYEYSRARVPGAGFDDLQGAVADVGRIKAALAQSHGLKVDVPGAGCTSGNGWTETLTDTCATRDAILAAWRRALAASRAGDTLILYFAGHGSRFQSDFSRQASGYHSTLMGADARKPGGQIAGDIFDTEVGAIINAATAAGVRVVTLFDSCNSGTASRDGASATRSAPDLVMPGLRLPPPEVPAAHGAMGGYRVHLAAAADGQDAKEVGGVGNRAGVFTTALAAALTMRPQASFADLAAVVVEDVRSRTGGRQVPHAEGALRATLGGPEIRVPTHEVVESGGRLLMLSGALLGVTQGSRFALYADTGGAVAGGGPGMLQLARVVRVEDGLAVLEPEGAAMAVLPGRMVARELEHRFAGVVLRLASDVLAARTVVERLDFAKLDPRAGLRLETAGRGTELQGAGGVVLARLPAADAADFGLRLAQALEKIARVEAWLARLKTGGAAAGVSLCAVNDDPELFDPKDCPAVPSGGRALKLGEAALVSVRNRSPGPRFMYLLVVDQFYEVTLLLPAAGWRDPAIDAGNALLPPEGQDVVPDAAGPLKLVALASDAPLNAQVLEQTAAGVLDEQACVAGSLLPFCREVVRTRSGDVPRVTAWAAAMEDVKVVP